RRQGKRVACGLSHRAVRDEIRRADRDGVQLARAEWLGEYRSRVIRGSVPMRAKPANVDEYLAPLSADKRAALEKLRRAIKSAVPNAEECISYNIPTYRL